MRSEKYGGDVDYAIFGQGYAGQRRPDPRIEAFLHRHLGDAKTVLNVGAGTGSYEPLDRHVIAIEPSAAMRAQRPSHLVPAINAFAEQLPLDDQSVDASMAIVTVHQWSDTRKGLAELKRVTRGPILVVTADGDELDRFWLADYAPEMIAVERRRYPRVEMIQKALGDRTEIHSIPIPIDCVDGWSEAYYARPEAFLDEQVRRSQSAWSFVPAEATERSLSKLKQDLETGKWDERYGHWRTMPEFEGSFRLILRAVRN